MRDRRTARTFQTIAAQMRELTLRRIKPMMKMQDELIYQLATLDLHLEPLQKKVNQTMGELKNVQHYIETQTEKLSSIVSKDSKLKLQNNQI